MTQSSRTIWSDYQFYQIDDIALLLSELTNSWNYERVCAQCQIKTVAKWNSVIFYSKRIYARPNEWYSKKATLIVLQCSSQNGLVASIMSEDLKLAQNFQKNRKN